MSTAVAAGWWSQHGVHALTLAGPVVVFALIALGADARAWLRKRRTPAAWSLMHTAAVLSLGAAAVHVAVCPEHFREGLVYGVFFAVTSTAQFGWSALVFVRDRLAWLAPVGLVGNAGLVLLWAVTRTVGIPVGPQAGEVERVGALDLVCQGCELAVVAICVFVVLRAQAIRHDVQPWQKQHRSGCATRSSSA